MYVLGRLISLPRAAKACWVILSTFNFLSLLTLFRRPRALYEMSKNMFAAFNRFGRAHAMPESPLRDILPDGTGPTSLFLSADKETSVTLGELVCLCSLAKLGKAKNILEIGTFAGVTTYHLAKNTEAACKVFTMDLPEEYGKAEAIRDAWQEGKCYTDLPTIQVRPRRENLCYVGTDVENKVVQIFADSSTYDYAENFSQKFDLIFVDGSHDYDHVRIDSANALQWVADDGVIVWHDYEDFPEITFGVKKCLNELRRNYNIMRIADTSLCVFRNRGGQQTTGR